MAVCEPLILGTLTKPAEHPTSAPPCRSGTTAASAPHTDTFGRTDQEREGEGERKRETERHRERERQRNRERQAGRPSEIKRKTPRLTSSEQRMHLRWQHLGRSAWGSLVGLPRSAHARRTRRTSLPPDASSPGRPDADKKKKKKGGGRKVGGEAQQGESRRVSSVGVAVLCWYSQQSGSGSETGTLNSKGSCSETGTLNRTEHALVVQPTVRDMCVR
eukprot:23933-Rhodomonas_salina.1